MDQDFINRFIEKLSNKNTELIKNELILQVQLDIAQNIISNLNEEITKLKEQVEKLSTKKKKENIEPAF
jgi:CII-binding regulator of phage lambda lysogenization HflD